MIGEKNLTRDTQRVKIWRKNQRSLTLPHFTLSQYAMTFFCPSLFRLLLGTLRAYVIHCLMAYYCVLVDQNLIFDTKFPKKNQSKLLSATFTSLKPLASHSLASIGGREFESRPRRLAQEKKSS